MPEIFFGSAEAPTMATERGSRRALRFIDTSPRHRPGPSSQDVLDTGLRRYDEVSIRHLDVELLHERRELLDLRAHECRRFFRRRRPRFAAERFQPLDDIR